MFPVRQPVSISPLFSNYFFTRRLNTVLFILFLIYDSCKPPFNTFFVFCDGAAILIEPALEDLLPHFPCYWWSWNQLYSRHTGLQRQSGYRIPYFSTTAVV